MNILSDGPAINENKFGSIEQNIKSNGDNQITHMNKEKDEYTFLKFYEQNSDFFQNDWYDIRVYYSSTCKYFLNSEEYHKIFANKKISRNFVRKDMMNAFIRNNCKNNYNDNYYINNNYEQNNNCIYKNDFNFFYKNYNDNNIQLKKFFLGKNLYINEQFTNCLKNNVYNNSINGQHSDVNLSSVSNKTFISSKINNANINIPKKIINHIDCPPFIPSNYSKKESESFVRKNSKDSSSKDKESDSTSSISEKRDDEVGNIHLKRMEKKPYNEKLEAADYLVEMFGRRGWICKLCNNFNYETRVKCNKCGILKRPKTLMELKQGSVENHDKEGDWKCIHCKNINYSFRTLCNRCKLPKMIPFLNYNNNQLVNQIYLPIYKTTPSLFYFGNGKTIISNNYGM